MDDSGLYQLILDQDLYETIKEIIPGFEKDNNNNNHLRNNNNTNNNNNSNLQNHNGNHSHGLKRKESSARAVTDKNSKKMAEGKP